MDMTFYKLEAVYNNFESNQKLIKRKEGTVSNRELDILCSKECNYSTYAVHIINC